MAQEIALGPHRVFQRRRRSAVVQPAQPTIVQRDASSEARELFNRGTSNRRAHPAQNGLSGFNQGSGKASGGSQQSISFAPGEEPGGGNPANKYSSGNNGGKNNNNNDNSGNNKKNSNNNKGNNNNNGNHKDHSSGNKGNNNNGNKGNNNGNNKGNNQDNNGNKNSKGGSGGSGKNGNGNGGSSSKKGKSSSHSSKSHSSKSSASPTSSGQSGSSRSRYSSSQDGSSSHPSISSANDYGSASTIQNLMSSSSSAASSSGAGAGSTVNGNRAATGHGVGGSDLSVGAVVGIAVGGAAGLALLGLIAWLIARWASKSQKAAAQRPMQQQPSTPMAGDYHSPPSVPNHLPPSHSNASINPSYEGYGQPMIPATYEGYYPGNGYTYRDPVAEAAAGVHPPPPVAQPGQNVSYVPGQAVGAPVGAPVPPPPSSRAAESQAAFRRRSRKKRNSRFNDWVDAEIDPVADYGADPYRTAGVGTHWSSMDHDARAHQSSSEDPNSWLSTSEPMSDKLGYEEHSSDVDTASRQPRRTQRHSMYSAMRDNPADWDQGMPDTSSGSYDNSRKMYEAEDEAMSELPYATLRHHRRTTRDLNPSHDIDLDASQAADNLRAMRRRAAQSGRTYF